MTLKEGRWDHLGRQDRLVPKELQEPLAKQAQLVLPEETAQTEPQDPRDQAGPRDCQGPQDQAELQDCQDPQDRQDLQEPRDQ